METVMTGWFNCVTQPPVRVGWYDLRTNEELEASRCWWDGYSWHMWRPDGSGINAVIYWGDRSQWRGLSEEAAFRSQEGFNGG